MAAAINLHMSLVIEFHKLDMSQKCALVQKNQNENKETSQQHTRLCQLESLLQIQGSDSFTLFGTGKASHEVPMSSFGPNTSRKMWTD